jgi:hypothetical protein
MSAQVSIWWPWGASLAGSLVASFAIGSILIRNRVQNVAAAAHDLGFTFTAWNSGSATKFETALFQKDPGGGFKNVMTGNYAGLDTQVFDYSCTTGSPQNSTTTVQTVAAYAQNVDLPFFAPAPQSLAGKIVDALQHQNVDLDSSPGFSRRYAVHGPDKERIRSLFNARLSG